MNTQRAVLSAYGFMLHLYPAAFRQRFAQEMLELAAAAQPAEWPLIFGDTSLAIVRSWIEPPESCPTPAPAGPDLYLAIGESTFKPLRLLQGLVLSITIILGLSYVSQRFPMAPPCREISTELVPTTSPRRSPPGSQSQPKAGREKVQRALTIQPLRQR